MKKCNICGETKPLTEYHKRKAAPDGYQYKCRSCASKASLKWQSDNKPSIHESYVIRYGDGIKVRAKRYGLDPDVLQKMIDDADGVCKICDDKVEVLHIDHCHDTLAVRGLLCKWCNVGLGNFRDNTERLEAAIEYLTTHQGRR